KTAAGRLSAGASGYIRKEIDGVTHPFGVREVKDARLSQGAHNRVAVGGSTGLLGHGEGAKEEQLVFNNGAAQTAAELISDERILRKVRSVVQPGIGVQSGVAKIFINAPVKGIAPAAGDEINLHVRDAVPSVHTQLVGLDGHFFHVLNPG